MLTKVAKQCINFPINGNDIIPYYTSASKYGVIKCKDSEGSVVYVPFASNGGNTSITFGASGPSTSNATIVVGTGNTPATEDDYTLDSIITTLTGTLTTTENYDSVNNIYSIRKDCTLSNNTENNITIKEVGLFLSFVTTSTPKGAITGSTNKKAILIDRVVLDTPLTIEAGGAGVLRYSFNFPGLIPSE